MRFAAASLIFSSLETMISPVSGSKMSCAECSRQTVGNVQLFIEFVAADLDHVVAAGIEKRLCRCWRTNRPSALRRGAGGGTVDEAVLFALGGILFDGGGDHAVVPENIGDGGVRAEAQRTQKDGGADLALTVDVHPQHALGILLEFQPRAAVGDDGGLEHFPARFVFLRFVVRTGRTHELGNDDALRTVEIKEPFSVIKGKSPMKTSWSMTSSLTLLTRRTLRARAAHTLHRGCGILFVVFGLGAEFMVEKIQLKVIGMVGNGREILKHSPMPSSMNVLYDSFWISTRSGCR